MIVLFEVYRNYKMIFILQVCIWTNPNAIAIDIASPIQADFPLPRAAVIAIVVRSVLSEIESASLRRVLD